MIISKFKTLSKICMLKKIFRDPNISRERESRGVSVYGSINGMLGIQKSRRDEMEQIGYILIKFLRGNLPWPARNDKIFGLLDLFAYSQGILAITYQLGQFS